MSGQMQPKQAFIKGALWTISGRWLVRILGLLNTVVLARILMPSDYGVVAMAMLLVGLIQAMSDMGVAAALLRNKDTDDQDIHSAWTLRCLHGVAMASITILVAPFVATFFSEPRVFGVLIVIAACMALDGFGSLGPVLAQKVFDFSLDFKLQIASKTAGVLSGWAAAVLVADYRALVIGIVAGYLARFVLGYAMHAYRPRWSTSRIASIWAFSRWLMLSSSALFLLRRSDELIAAKISSPASFGAYHVGSDIGRAPVDEIGPPLMKAFLPVLANFKDDRARLNGAVLKAISATGTLTIPVAVGLWMMADPLVEVILGARWIEAAPVLGVFALVSQFQFFVSPLTSLLILHGYTKTQSKAAWLELLVFIVAVSILLPPFQLIGLVWARLIAAASNAILMMMFVDRLASLRAFQILQHLWRPCLGAGAMALLLWAMDPLPMVSSFGSLLISICVGASFYIAWCAITWRMAGQPEGLESTALDIVKNWRQRMGA